MTLPEGLIYAPGFLAEAEERDLVTVLATFDLHPYVLHDTPSRRLVRSFGLALVTGAYDAGPAAPIPAELSWIRDRCAALMGREPEELADLLVTRYPPGAGIGWHRDAPQFRDVSGVSLLTACRMRFRRGRTRAWETAELTLERRSAYVPVRPGAEPMAAPDPSGYGGAVVDDVPDPASRSGWHPVRSSPVPSCLCFQPCLDGTGSGGPLLVGAYTLATW
jgi:alkylated DNA repair protein (DNA oxidative demethylase)